MTHVRVCQNDVLECGDWVLTGSVKSIRVSSVDALIRLEMHHHSW
jgi:hypothetical protein